MLEIYSEKVAVPVKFEINKYNYIRVHAYWGALDWGPNLSHESKIST